MQNNRGRTHFRVMGVGLLLFISCTLYAQPPTPEWIYTYNSVDSVFGSLYDEATSLVVDPSGNFYAAGLTDNLDNDMFFTVIKINPNGDQEWIYTYGDSTTRNRADDILYDPTGFVYAAGLTENPGTDWDFTVVKLDTLGTQEWVFTYNGPGNYRDAATSLALDPSGNVYAAGFSSGVGTSFDITVIKLMPGGTLGWIYTYNGPGNGIDNALDILYDPSGKIYVAGFSMQSSWDMTVVRHKRNGRVDLFL